MSACQSWGEKPAGRRQGSIAPQLRAQRRACFGKTRGLPPPLCPRLFPLHPALPATVVQVEQESVVPKFLEGLIVVPVHVACGRATNLPLGGGPGGGSRDMEHPPGARPKPRGWGKGLGAPLSCLSGGHDHGGAWGDLSGAPGASRPLLILAAPWRDNSGKWSRSNGKGTAAAARGEETGSSPSQMMAGDSVGRKERPQGQERQHEPWGTSPPAPAPWGLHMGALLGGASHAWGVQLGSPWHLSSFGFCLGCVLTAQPFALVLGKSAALCSLSSGLANKPCRARRCGTWSCLGLSVPRGPCHPQCRHSGAHP